jgi:hypothetical protein
VAPRRGYLTLATGSRGFLEMAVDMTLSLREHTELPVALAADDGLAAVAGRDYRAVFDDVTTVPERFLGSRMRKFGTAEASPFDETMFVDADCIVLGPLDHLFAPLAEHDMAMLGEQLGPDADENHHGFSTRSLMRRFGLQRYLKTNSGIFCFRTEPAREIMEECRRCFLEEARPRLAWSILLGRWLGDEIAFGIVGGRRELGTLPLPHPMYWPHEFDALDLERPTKPLLHFIWPPPTPVLEALLADMQERRARAGVDGSGEERWRAEVKELRNMARRRRLLERVGWW